jgi:16S rRNA (uracil1498-N3)-methyltransferase
VSPPVFHADRALLAGERVRLDGAEGRHAALVRRIGPGERVDLTDGAGLMVACVVASADRESLELDVVERVEWPAPEPRLVVVQALPKGDRGETAVETMTEVGVDAVVPWQAARCVTRWRDERGRKALGKWRVTAREAAKQSRRAWWPLVDEPAETDGVAGLLRSATLGVVLHESADRPLADVAVPKDGDVVIVVGPEGGIADDELACFAAAGAVACRMGPTVLRTSTAATVAAGVLLARAGRWN